MNRTVGIVILLLVVLGVAIYINAQRRDETEWQDGTYVARSAPDERGYFGEIELVIANGKITKAQYEEMDREGRRKDENYPYPAGPQSHDEYEKRLIQTQKPDEVNAITGATQTHGRFVEAAREALRKATQGDQSRPPAIQPPPTPPPPPVDKEQAAGVQWKDGTYTARTEADERGYYGEIELVVADRRIEEARYNEKNQAGEPKGEAYPYPLYLEAKDKYEKSLLETQDPEKVDVVSGATHTWEWFKQTAKEALQKAQ